MFNLRNSRYFHTSSAVCSEHTVRIMAVTKQCVCDMTLSSVCEYDCMYMYVCMFYTGGLIA